MFSKRSREFGKTIVFLNPGAAFILFRISFDISETP
jgi:hypothetical protein